MSLPPTGMAETATRLIPKDVVRKNSINENNDIPVFTSPLKVVAESDFLRPIRREIYLHH